MIIEPEQLLVCRQRGYLVPFLFLLPKLRRDPEEKNILMIRFKSSIRRFELSEKTPHDVEQLKIRLQAVTCMARYFTKGEWSALYKIMEQMEVMLRDQDAMLH